MYIQYMHIKASFKDQNLIKTQSGHYNSLIGRPVTLVGCELIFNITP